VDELPLTPEGGKIGVAETLVLVETLPPLAVPCAAMAVYSSSGDCKLDGEESEEFEDGCWDVGEAKLLFPVRPPLETIGCSEPCGENALCCG
jgi:hypothetical protein